jgi:hypothetical protein
LTSVEFPAAKEAASLCASRFGRCVERGDRQGHADRRPVGERGGARTALPAGDRQDLAADPARLRGGDGERVGHPVDLAPAVPDRLAQFEGEQPGQVVAPGQSRAGGPLQHLGAGRR